jgi:hypothetical protein
LIVSHKGIKVVGDVVTVDPAAIVAVPVLAAVEEVPELHVKSFDLTSVTGELSTVFKV